MDVYNYIHIFLNLFVVAVHATSITIFFRSIGDYEKAEKGYEYTLKGWLKIKTKRGKELGSYLFRLTFVAVAIMLTMNTWHLFTFMSEAAPSIKNISWRIGNLFMAVVCLILAKEFYHESRNNAVS